MKNLAFIDGQNLYMGTTMGEKPWKVDLMKFRVYLEKKYDVTEAHYFLGYVQDTNQELYEEIQKAGFILVFRQHNTAMIGKKKGNVDSDIIFQVMKRLYKNPDFDQTPSLPDAAPRSHRPRCGGRESKFLAADLVWTAARRSH